MNAAWSGPLFMVGCSRSGTTLLQQMLNAHTRVAIAPETHFVERFWARADHYGDVSEGSTFRRLLEDVVATDVYPDLGIRAEIFLEGAGKVTRTFPAVFDLLMELFARAKGATVRGEKTPGHIRYMDTLADAFPEARFIHMIRDPRAVVNSRRRLPWVSCSTADNARFWAEAARAGRRGGKQRGARFRTLRYEDLISRPETELRGLCRFLEIEFEPAMLEYWRYNRHLVNVQREPWKARALQPLEPEAATRWRAELASEDIREIEAVTWPLMTQFDYHAETPLFELLSRVLYRATRDGRTGARRFLKRLVRWG